MPRQISQQSQAAKFSAKRAEKPKYTISPASHGRYIIHIAGMRYIFDTEGGSTSVMPAGRS